MLTNMKTTSTMNGGILLDTMQLVESTEPQPVPNHVLDTKIYRRTGQSQVVASTPTEVHFAGFYLGKKCSQHFSITNVCGDVISINIIPPQSKYFKLHYKKPGIMIPGIKLDCHVEFIADEFRYYYDRIRVNCPGEENIVVPIHAYPVMNTDGFPKFYRFPAVSTGEYMQNTFTLFCDVPVEFEFQLKFLQTNPAFTVEPMEGVIPANGSVDIIVTFAPLEFQTSSIQLELRVSQFNSQPITCTITGSSVPGLLREKQMKEWQKNNKMPVVLDPRSVTPLDRSRLLKKKLQEPEKEVFEYKGIVVPYQNISTLTVAKVLSEKSGQLKAKDLRNALKAKDSKVLQPNLQMKEAAFKLAVQQNIDDERQNKLRWQSKIGEEPLNEQTKAFLMEKRQASWNLYTSEIEAHFIFENLNTECRQKRISRFSTEIPEKLATFDMFRNNLWWQKLYVQQKFVQCVRKIILQNRAYRNMLAFRALKAEWKDRKYVKDLISQCLKRRIMKEKSKKQRELFNKNININQYQNDFVTVNPPENSQPRFELSKLESEKQLDVREKTTVPFFDLMVPQYYELQEYQVIQFSTDSYLTPEPSDYFCGRKQLAETRSPHKLVARMTKHTLKELEGTSIVSTEPQILQFSLPQLLLQPALYTVDHIFNPLPNVQSYECPFPYSEGDADYHLCPVPRFPQVNASILKCFTSQKKFLDKLNVINGIMNWKKYPSPTLLSLNTMPTLGRSWLPLQRQLFRSGSFLGRVPKTLNDMSSVSKLSGGPKNFEMEKLSLMGLLDPSKANITPEIVNEEFKLANDADLRKTRYEEEEEYTTYLLSEFDQLGSKIQDRILIYCDYAIDQDLVLR